MKSPQVSICIPAYNQVSYLRKTLESVKIQAFTDYEIIITDDSSDGSVKELVAEFDFGNKLKYVKNSKNLGSPENWNEAVRHASGEYIKMLHHDDWFTFPYSLGEYVKLLDMHPESDFAFSATSVQHSNGSNSISCPSLEILNQIKKNPGVLFFGNLVGGPSATIYRRKVNLQYDQKIKYVVDIDFYIRIISLNHSFQFTEQLLICTTNGAAHQVTAEFSNKETELFEYVYLYNKINRGAQPSREQIDFFEGLFNKFNIRSLNDFKLPESELPKPIPFFRNILFKRRMALFFAGMKNSVKI